jgi:hypothetical protein
MTAARRPSSPADHSKLIYELELGIQNFINAGATKTLLNSDSGALVKLDNAAGSVVTLPAALGTGRRYRFAVTVLATSNSHIVKVANSVDVMIGILLGVGAANTDLVGYSAGATDDTITLNRTTTGSVAKGEVIEVVDVAAGVWLVSGVFKSSGTQATPFSSTV